MTKTVRQFALKLAGMHPSTLYPLPEPVKPSSGILYSSLAIKWMGSAWAASYEISRVCKDGLVTVVAVGVQDDRPDGSTLFSDLQAANMVNCTYFVYPCSVDGRVNRKDAVPLRIWNHE